MNLQRALFEKVSLHSELLPDPLEKTFYTGSNSQASLFYVQNKDLVIKSYLKLGEIY